MKLITKCKKLARRKNKVTTRFFLEIRGNMTLHFNANNIRMPLIITF